MKYQELSDCLQISTNSSVINQVMLDFIVQNS